VGGVRPIDFWTVDVACVDGRRRISSWCRGWPLLVRSVRKWLVVGEGGKWEGETEQ
jgi:hypothetical protein